MTDFRWGFERSFSVGFYRVKNPGVFKKILSIMETKHLMRKGGFQNALSRAFEFQEQLEESGVLTICSHHLMCGNNLLKEAQMTAPCPLWFVVILDFENVFPITSSWFLCPHEICGHQGNIFKFNKQKAPQCPHYQKAVTREDNFIWLRSFIFSTFFFNIFSQLKRLRSRSSNRACDWQYLNMQDGRGRDSVSTGRQRI